MSAIHLQHGHSFGTAVARHQAGGVTFSCLQHPSPRTLPVHAHESAFFTMLVRGGYRERAGGREIDYAPMTVVFHPPELTHVDQIHDASLLVSLEVPRQFFDDYALTVPALAVQPFTASRFLLSLLHDEASPLAIEGSVLELLGDAARLPEAAETCSPPWLPRAIERLRSDPSTRVGELARDADVHPVHLARVFRRRVGTTPALYAQRVRLERALALLVDGRQSLGDVALASGFADQSHFCRAVHSSLGLTPRALRQMLRTC